MLSSDFDRMIQRQQQRLLRPRQRQQFLGNFRPSQPEVKPVVGGEYKIKDPPEREPTYEPADSVVRILGLDLGQMKDPAAAVMISRRKLDTQHPNRVKDIIGPKPIQNIPVEVELIHEWPKGTDYSKITQFCLNLHEITKGADGKDVYKPAAIDAVVFDMTGCGHPFRDFFLKEARAQHFPSRIIGVNLSSSDTALKVRHDKRGQFMTVAKLEMLTAINILAQQKMLRYPKGWTTQKLFDQMQTFSIKKTPAANITFEQGGQGHHGDVCIALGLCCFYMQRGFRELSLNDLPQNDPWEDSRIVGIIR